MSNSLKKLASETAVYGITHTLGRFLNVLLVPIYTHIFPVEEYGVINVYFAVVGLAIVLLLYGMETAFFNFARENNPEKTLSTALSSVSITTGIFIVLGFLLRHQVANFLEYPDQTNFVVIFVFILAFDALATLPLAWLRFKKRPLRFGAIRLINIGLNIGFNLFFLFTLPWLDAKGIHLIIYNPTFGIGYVFVANLIASGITLLMVLPEFKIITNGFDKALWQKMFRYARPLIWVGLAGIVNETIDRILLKKLLPANISDFEVGVYGGFYKLSIIITLAVQSFRFAAEPFFFDHSKQENAQKTYAKVMHYFVLMLSGIFLFTAVFAEPIGRLFLQKQAYFEHPQWRYLVPILLLANLFLGIMYNLNIWYKLNNKTRIGMYISIGGALMTLVLNFALIPLIGILGSAITTLIVYAGMTAVSYVVGQKHYPVPYNLKIIGFYIISVLVLYIMFEGFRVLTGWIYVPGFTVLILFSLTAYYIERPIKKG